MPVNQGTSRLATDKIVGVRIRSVFARRPNDAYATPLIAVEALAPYLYPETQFAEPCAGAGDLIRHLEALGHVCRLAIDIDPKDPRAARRDALSLARSDMASVSCSITNLPFNWQMFEPLCWHILTLAPLWTLSYAAFLFNARSAPLVDHAEMVVPTRRLKWISGSRDCETKDTVWIKFDRNHRGGPRILPRSQGRSAPMSSLLNTALASKRRRGP